MEKNIKTRKNITTEDINKIKELYWLKAPHQFKLLEKEAV